MTTYTYAASRARGPRNHAAQHRAKTLASWQRIIVVISTFVLSAVSLSGGLVMLIDAGIPVGVYWAPLTLLTLAGACYAAMVVAVASKDL